LVYCLLQAAIPMNTKWEIIDNNIIIEPIKPIDGTIQTRRIPRTEPMMGTKTNHPGFPITL